MSSALLRRLHIWMSFCSSCAREQMGRCRSPSDCHCVTPNSWASSQKKAFVFAMLWDSSPSGENSCQPCVCGSGRGWSKACATQGYRVSCHQGFKVPALKDDSREIKRDVASSLGMQPQGALLWLQPYVGHKPALEQFCSEGEDSPPHTEDGRLLCFLWTSLNLVFYK